MMMYNRKSKKVFTTRYTWLARILRWNDRRKAFNESKPWITPDDWYLYLSNAKYREDRQHNEYATYN